MYCRQYEEGGRISACAGDLQESEFLRVLEEIALAVWHGDGRTATVSSIREKFKSGRIETYLDRFQEGAKAGVTRLLTAFYFRQSDNRQDGDPTFEFTHKSFGEYLTALRIIRLLRQMQKQRRRQEDDPDDGWSEKEALQHWTSFCAVTEMDRDLLRFISNEFRVMTQDELLALQGMVRELLSYTINQGLPFPDEFLSKGFKEHLRLAGNAEETLLAVHFHIAELTNEVSRLDLESDGAFGNWIFRLIGPYDRVDRLGFLDLSGYILGVQNFHSANFAMSCLKGTRLSYSTLAYANLSGVNLEKAHLFEANLVGANLEGANFKNADLSWAKLQDVNLKGANLEGAELSKVNLQGANLQGAIFESKHFAKVLSFEGANLKGTIMINKDS